VKTGTCHLCCALNVTRVSYPCGDGHERQVCAECIDREAGERGGALVWVAIAFVFYLAAALSYVAYCQVAGA